MTMRILLRTWWIATAVTWVGACGSAESEGPGNLTGSVSVAGGIDCSSAPDDCIGPVFLYVVAENPVTNPAQTPVALAVVEGADLSGGRSAPYDMLDVPSGAWWLAVFQDDDENASRLAPMADRGDPVPFPFPQFVVRPGGTTTQNVVLSVRTP